MKLGQGFAPCPPIAPLLADTCEERARLISRDGIHSNPTFRRNYLERGGDWFDSDQLWQGHKPTSAHPSPWLLPRRGLQTGRRYSAVQGCRELGQGTGPSRFIPGGLWIAHSLNGKPRDVTGASNPGRSGFRHTGKGNAFGQDQSKHKKMDRPHIDIPQNRTSVRARPLHCAAYSS
jgi:hypothetical protein